MLDIFKLVLKLPHWSWSFITLAPKQEMLSNIFVSVAELYIVIKTVECETELLAEWLVIIKWKNFFSAIQYFVNAI